jgi:GNAT superfamily N-acetyltransferase
MSDIAIRFAGPEDGAALAATIDAMDRYFGDPERPSGETRAAVEGWLRDGGSATRYVLAFAGDEPLGFASFAVVHPGSGLRGLMFLKDIFVMADHRNHGIGERIMQFLAEFCTSHGLGHIDWVVETERSQAFYERLGATLKPHKRFMRLDGKALADLARK